MRLQIITNIGSKFRRAELEGRPHLVVPCGMLVEDVIEGSQGPLFYPEEEIEKSVSAWNGMPIVIDHPEIDGEFISARNAEVFNTRKVGVLLESEFDGKLRAECWFDEERTKAVDKRVYNAIIKKKKMEVSTGLDCDKLDKEGEFNGKKYTGVVSNFKPDHLAILPDKIGACSIAMGAGLFANVSKEPESIQEVLTHSITNALKRIGGEFVNNELSFSQRSRAVCDLLSAKYGKPGKYWNGYIEDVYEDYVVFYEEGKTWKQEYTVVKDKVSLSGDAVEVRRVVSYTANQSPTPEEVSTMAFNKKAFVDKLIANGDAAETDREKLMSTEDSVLALWEVSTPTAPKIKEVETPAPVANAKKEAEPTDEELIAKLPRRLRKIVNRAEEKENALREDCITKIIANKANKLKKEYLDKQDTEVLEGMVAILPVANASGDDDDDDDDSPFLAPRRGANYEGAAGAVTANGADDDEDDVLVPIATVNFADPRKKR